MTTDAQQRLVKSPIPHSCPDVGEDEIAEMLACVHSLQLKGGARVAALESAIAGAMDYPGAVATSSGAESIHIALRTEFPSGKARVGVPSYICRSVYDAVCLANCQPVLLDIDPDTLSVVPGPTSSACDAVIVAHMFGIRADIDSWLRAGKVLIEDCAQRIPDHASLRTEPQSHYRVLSFEATKLLTGGEGGLLLCNDDTSLRRARSLRDAPYDFAETAICSLMTDIQAAIVSVQWRRLPEFLEVRRQHAAFYIAALGRDGVFPAILRADTFPFRFLLQVADPDAFIRYGAEHGVSFRRPIAPLPLHRLFPAAGDFPHTGRAFATLVSIPLYPRLSQTDMNHVAEVAAKAAEVQA